MIKVYVKINKYPTGVFKNNTYTLMFPTFYNIIS